VRWRPGHDELRADYGQTGNNPVAPAKSALQETSFHGATLLGTGVLRRVE
jgi:hypothetical protein